MSEQGNKKNNDTEPPNSFSRGGDVDASFHFVLTFKRQILDISQVAYETHGCWKERASRSRGSEMESADAKHERKSKRMSEQEISGVKAGDILISAHGNIKVHGK